MRANKRILIIDDHLLFADGLSLILSNLSLPVGLDKPSACVKVDVCSDAFKALEDKQALRTYDLVLIDLHMPRFNGFGFLTAVQTQKLMVPVAVISGTEKKSDIEKAIRLGACGFIPKDSDSSEMLNAVQNLLEGKRYIPKRWDGKVDWVVPEAKKIAKDTPLTSRQRQVLELMRDGLQNKQIAMVLGVSVSSIKGHVELLFKNLQVNNRTACVQVAREKKLI